MHLLAQNHSIKTNFAKNKAMNIMWNWGTKLTLWIIVFMLFIFVLVFFSFKNTILLVEKDYYPKGMKFQDRIDEKNNAFAIKDQFQIEQQEQYVVISFPEINPDTGTVVFYRHNDNLLDQTLAIIVFALLIVREKKSDRGVQLE